VEGVPLTAGQTAFMRLKLEQLNVNDLQYNLVKLPPIPNTQQPNTGNLFDIANTAGSNVGLGSGTFGANTGVFGFVAVNGNTGNDFGLGPLIPPGPAPAILITIVQPGTITPGPFPPPP